MEKIIVYSAGVKQHLRQLIHILYKKEYFGFRKDAKLYVTKITNFIEQKIATYPTKNTPIKLLQYGEKYLVYKANQSTTWYIFFSQIEQHYFIKFITNNHSSLIGELNIDY